MSLLLPPALVGERRAAAAGPLRSLAESLASDLEPLLMDGFTVPHDKARLSRTGGRCADDSTLLEFDPFSPRAHRCPRCGRVYGDEAHYRWWVMSYQLWLAERAVHGALLRLLRGDTAAGTLAESILDVYADAYLDYPNRDNVLGPTRMFFSTYLESIWLLQVCTAIDLLEMAGDQRARGARVRERIIEPSSQLIRSYDEGASNRQVWNNAALLASSVLLGSYPAAEAIVWGPSGLVSHLAQGLLSDGTWYEGENYHLFAHRGLWYGVQMAERLDVGLAEPFVAPFIERFNAGFAASFITALPDLTLPSRRDSQYAISVRQWRFAELCELGLRRTADARVLGMLGRLYSRDIPRGETGRSRSTAEVERNLPPTALTRADLGWRSLLLAHAELPTTPPGPQRSILLDGQGLAILRRDGGELYAALDYGHSGGGHGHPDRLNVQLAHGPVRWLDDTGTGSYVDPTLHWYRSTLAHNAPLVDGHSQARVHGSLLAYEDSGEFGWVRADVESIAPGAAATRTVVATPGYVIDILEWRVAPGATLDLPIHLDVDPLGERVWVNAPLVGGDGLEDGFDFVSDAAVAHDADAEAFRLGGMRQGRAIASWTSVDAAHEWWSATGPGAPGAPPARFYLLRSRAPEGTARTVLDWSQTVRAVHFTRGAIVVECADDTTHTHAALGDGWHIDVTGPASTLGVDLGGARPRAPTPGSESSAAEPPAPRQRRTVIPRSAAASSTLRHALTASMGEKHYRRSELSWSEAGQPRATVSLGAAEDALHIHTQVHKSGPPTFAPARAQNELDNEDPDINSDGVQIHLATVSSPDMWTWLVVPEPGGGHVRIRRPAGGPDLGATWSATPDGYAVHCVVALPRSFMTDGFDLDIIVNEISPDRERRRGQLVLSGAPGEWIYLRGDRQPRHQLLHFVIADRDSRS